MNVVCIAKIDHRNHAMASAIHAVQMSAYAQEAKLLGISDFPPLHVTVHQIEHSREQFFVARVSNNIVGAISIEPPGVANWSGDILDHGGVHIASFVVHPDMQRQGIGRQLVDAVITAHSERPITVSTAVRNDPAIKVFSRLGFSPYARKTVGDELVEIVLLRREAVAT